MTKKEMSMSSFERFLMFWLCLEDGFWYVRQGLIAWRWLILDDSPWMREIFWESLNKGTSARLFD
jgi:hypothetical protein